MGIIEDVNNGKAVYFVNSENVYVNDNCKIIKSDYEDCFRIGANNGFFVDIDKVYEKEQGGFTDEKDFFVTTSLELLRGSILYDYDYHKKQMERLAKEYQKFFNYNIPNE